MSTTESLLFKALCASLPPDVRKRPDVTAALRGVLLGAQLQRKEVVYEKFTPHPADVDLVDAFLRIHPRLGYGAVFKSLGGFGLGYRTWFEMCLTWAKHDWFGEDLSRVDDDVALRAFPAEKPLPLLQ